METKRGYEDKVLVDDPKHGVYRMLRAYEGRNGRGERVEVEFMKCTNPHTRHSMPRMWHENGWTDEELETWWHVDTYAYKDDGWPTCHGGYNPTTKKAEGRPGAALDFAWVLPATRENLELIASEFERRAFA